MTDIQKLKALAEAQPEKVWTRSEGDLSMMTGARMYYVAGPEGASDWENWGFTRRAASFIAAANPAAVLELIAEIETLGRYLCTCRDCGGEGSLHTGDWHNYGHMDPPEPVMEKCGECDGTGLLGVVQDLYQVITERDQLKAENTDLHATLQAAKGEIERLKGENEALRKDAERYRWLRKNTSVILDRKTSYQAETGFIKFDTMPARSEMQTAIDAAISKEAIHD